MKVKKGVSVNWHNADPVTHNIVSYDGITFNSGDIKAGSSFRYETITTGVFAYRCTIHGDAGGALYINP
jgi:plastocyanin